MSLAPAQTTTVARPQEALGTTGPYRWQTALPARIARRALRYRTITRYVEEACTPLTIEGAEHATALGGRPAIVIANHSSHLDSLVISSALPEAVRSRLAFGGAADRFFTRGRRNPLKQGWYHSLSLNVFPIVRGGGTSSLAYARELLDKGWSVMLFPEGTRSVSGELGKFKHGVSILALEAGVPVLPMYLHGLQAIRPKGTKDVKPGPVTARIGAAIDLATGTAVPEATARLRAAMESLQDASPSAELLKSA